MKRLQYLVLLFVCVVFNGLAQQEPGCGTTVTAKEIDYINSILNKSLATEHGRLSDVNNSAKFIAITPHIVRRSDGTGGLAESQLLDAIEYLNETYEPMNMTFFIIDGVNYIDSDDYFDFDSSQEDQITAVHNVPNTINIYFYNSLSSGSNGLCGYAYFPSTGRDHVMMANGCTVNRGSTLPHEIGHYFNLYHTHGKSNNGTTDELVDGSNCLTAGDDLCDTPADPNLAGKVNGDCAYTGTNRDANGELYAPNPRNFMSYAPGQCRELFSSDQANRIVNAYETFKTYLIDKYYIADFSSKGRRICEGESIQFIDESIAASSLSWEFPGGNPSTSTDKFPLVSYENPGTYDVTLSITTENGDTETKLLSSYITVLGDEMGVESTSGSFEESSLDEEVINDDFDITFEKSSAAYTEGSNSVEIDFLNYSSIGAEDYLIAEKINTSVNKQLQITFDYAYSRYNNDFSDGLAIVIKNSCGEWSEVWKKSGANLATAEDHTTRFVPLANEWSSQSLIVQIPQAYDNTEVAFKAINGFGNVLYIDNYSIEPINAAFSIESVDVTNASCSNDDDGSIAVSTSGLNNLEYSIDGENFQNSNTFQDLKPGDYIISVRENELSDVIITTSSVGPDPIFYTSNVVDPLCSEEASGTVEFLLEGGTGALEINFDDQGFSDALVYENLMEGTYRFEIQDENNCSLIGTLTISAANQTPTKPVINTFSSILSIQVDPDIKSIQWFLDGEPIEEATKSTLPNPVIGEYTVEVSNEFCSIVSDPFIVLSTDELRSKLIVYPNPIDGELYIDLPIDLQKSVRKTQILDLSGKPLIEGDFASKIDVSNLKSGLYMIRLTTEHGVVSKKIIKR